MSKDARAVSYCDPGLQDSTHDGTDARDYDRRDADSQPVDQLARMNQLLESAAYVPQRRARPAISSVHDNGKSLEERIPLFLEREGQESGDGAALSQGKPELWDESRLGPDKADPSPRSKYLPAELTHEHYPNLIAEGTTVPTIANRALLVAYSWPEDSPRYKKIAKFVDTFFGKIDQFNSTSRHPKWREVNLSAEMPGWIRFKPAADWLASHRNLAMSTNPDNSFSQSAPELKLAFEQFIQNYASSSGRKTLSTKERELLFAKFMKILAESRAEQSAR
ncbi:hypothetical protein [Nitrobacter sp. JJSN]|uniref:hypothetical protein n=1 Tax=Nitrobacter sp. JJSN TaxID=3453033 RepID=UPI003F7750D0